jgi:K+-transporting ATPase A subunit
MTVINNKSHTNPFSHFMHILSSTNKRGKEKRPGAEGSTIHTLKGAAGTVGTDHCHLNRLRKCHRATAEP